MRWFWLVPVALLAACGSKPTGLVKFSGFAPIRPQDTDSRTAIPYCGACGTKVDLGASKCKNAKCLEPLAWAESWGCGFCGASGECRPCRLLDQRDFQCSNCRGKGVLTYEGRSPKCPQCDGTGKCPMCKGTGKCDQCGGNRKMTRDQVAKLLKDRETKKDKDETQP